MNLYLPGELEAGETGGRKVRFFVETEYPGEGRVRILTETQETEPFVTTASLREITSSFAGDKLYSAPAAWADNARVGKAGRSSKKTESQHLAEMGRAYEHLEGAGGEKNFE